MSNNQATQTKETTNKTLNAPKKARTRVPKEVAKELEQETNIIEEIKEVKETQSNTNTKENEMESAKMEDVKVMMNGEEVKESNNVEEVEVVEVPQKEEVQEVQEVQEGILHRGEFERLTFAEQVKLMKYYRENYKIEDIKKQMGHSTSSYYALIKRLGLHDEIARPLKQPRGSKTQKTQTKQAPKTKEITHEFTSNGVAFEGDLNIQSLLEQIEGFIKLGGGEENFEFKFELIRK